MQDLHEKLDALDSNVKTLLRKLNEALQENQLLKNENNKLKLEINKIEVERGSEETGEYNSKSPSGVSEEKYHKIKDDIKSYIKEIDDCIELIEQEKDCIK
jgi:regulator of replication initiation timing